MIVATYFEPLEPKYEHRNHGALVELWKASWEAQGHAPLVIGRKEAMTHPDYARLKSKAASLPTVNPRQYEEACFIRWCAVASIASEDTPIVFMDYDVFPTEYWDGWPTNFRQLAHYGHIPSCISGAFYGFDRIISALLQHRVKPGTKHTSDMHILWANEHLFAAAYPWLRCYGTPNWEMFPMVHFGSWYMPGPDRSKIVSELLNKDKRVKVSTPFRLSHAKMEQLKP